MGDFGVLKINYIACSDCSKDDSWNSIIGGDIQIVEFQKWRVYDGKWNSKSGGCMMGSGIPKVETIYK